MLEPVARGGDGAVGLAFMQRLAALVPRPRLHLIRFFGLPAPNAKLRLPPRTPDTPTRAAPHGGSRGGAAPPVDSTPEDPGRTPVSRPNEFQAKRRVPVESGRGKGPVASSEPSESAAAAHAGVTRADKRPFEIPSANVRDRPRLHRAAEIHVPGRRLLSDREPCRRSVESRAHDSRRAAAASGRACDPWILQSPQRQRLPAGVAGRRPSRQPCICKRTVRCRPA